MKKLILGTVITGSVLLSGCTMWEDTVTSFQSNTKGLEREITVYSKTGEVLKTYEGTNVRTEVNDGGQIMINLGNGERIQVLNADVIVEEKVEN